MALLTPQQIDMDGLDPSYTAAAAGGDTADVPTGSRTAAHVKNGGGSSITVTVASQVTTAPAGTAAADQDVTVPAGEERLIGPISTAYVDDDGLVHLSYSDVTSVTVAVLRA